jgi:hypothetical protein
VRVPKVPEHTPQNGQWNDGPCNRLVRTEDRNQGLLIFASNLALMNTQEIITPVAKFIEWTFETVLVPISDPFNSGVIVLGLAGLLFWLRLQKKYTQKAEQDGDLV